MSTGEASERYSAVAIALHWAIALAMGGMIALGWNMHDAEHRPIEWLFQLHKSIGITILALTIARIAWRLMNPPPALPEAMPPLEKTASHIVHIGFYTLMLVMPLTGWLVVSVSPFSIATVLYGTIGWPHLPGLGELPLETRQEIFPLVEFVHSKLAWLLIGLVALHVAGALKHELSDEEGVLKRMVPRLFGKTTPPRAPGRGALTAFGSAALFFGVIAGTPVIAQSFNGADTTETAASDIAANWQIDYEASEIRFSGDYNGDAYSGTFADWSADIFYDPEALETSATEVIVNTASADTGSTLYDDTLKAGEWFNVSEFSTATVSLANFVNARGGPTADATLTIKGISVTVPFPHVVRIEGDTATMLGTANLSRNRLNLGQDSDASGDWVSDEVKVSVTVKASRIDG